ncbi:trypsin-like peptidase domain-containing protein [Gammaproteobacteria bacterium]|jgi:S1-C subfamily serine protease|nr:trypsin-like peptidase domain-containing protein [Gammaproteobacteria bacterium]
MKFFQTSFLNYVFVILLTFAGTWYFISDDKNKLVSASEKSISSVVTISSVNNKLIKNNRSGIGSGVIFSSDGYIVTNLHILSGQNINVKLDNGKNYLASIIGIDKNTDIAVLKISSSEELKPINFANSDSLKVGDRVLAIGNPYGIGISVSNGIISATGRDYGNPYLQLIQTDAAINPGNSGGALINENGNLIGINSKIFSKTGAYQGIGFAIPSNLVVQIATQLIKYGNVKTLWIGNFRVARTRINTNGKVINGLKIIEMENAGPLHNKGVRANDIIIGINDENANWNNLISSLKFATLGENLKLDLITNASQLKTINFMPST